MNLEDNMLSEISQSQRHKYCMIPLIQDAWSGQTCRDRKLEWWLLGAGGGRSGERLTRQSLFCEMKSILEVGVGDGGTTV